MRGKILPFFIFFATLVFTLPMLNSLEPNFKKGSAIQSIVERDKSEKFSKDASEIITKCAGDSTCYKDVLLGRIRNGESIDDSLALFTKITETSNGMSSGCNSVGRSAGEELFYKHGDKVFRYYSVICGHAYVYGFMIGLGKKYPDRTNGFTLKNYCLNDYNPVSCVYGAGYALSFATKLPSEAQERCQLIGGGLSRIDPRNTPSFQMTGPGDCLLGWASGVTDNLEISGAPSFKDFLQICSGMTGGFLRVCNGEVSFAYTFKNSPSVKERLNRLDEVFTRCQSDASYECMQFLGKAVVDHLIYTAKIDLKSDAMALDAAKTIERFCSGVSSKACFMGAIQDQLTHATHDDMMKLCSLFKSQDHRKFCLDTNLQHE